MRVLLLLLLLLLMLVQMLLLVRRGSPTRLDAGLAVNQLSSSTLRGVSRRRRCLDTQHSTLAPEGRVVLTT